MWQLLKNLATRKGKFKNEKELARACASGNREAQEELYNKYASKMYALCLRYAREHAEAEDFLHEGFIKVLSTIHQWRGTGSLESWMRRVFINVILEKLRSNKHRVYSFSSLHPEDEDGEQNWNSSELNVPAPDPDIISQLSEKEIISLIQRLPEGYRTVFNLYVIEGFSHKEIAQMLGISEGTAKSQLSRAKNLLRKWIEEHFYFKKKVTKDA
ncbi:MAG: RNA polymerase sigma factor [Chlorobi bacterium]|nr:RNA polymerase sigma factor [Chlorobiota bacterium]